MFNNLPTKALMKLFRVNFRTASLSPILSSSLTKWQEKSFTGCDKHSHPKQMNIEIPSNIPVRHTHTHLCASLNIITSIVNPWIIPWVPLKTGFGFVSGALRDQIHRIHPDLISWSSTFSCQQSIDPEPGLDPIHGPDGGSVQQVLLQIHQNKVNYLRCYVLQLQ